MSTETAKHPVLKLVFIGLALLLFFILLTCCYQVRVTEKAVLTTFEKPVSTISTPGLRFKWPWPVQKAYFFDTRTNLVNTPYLEYLLKDNTNIIIRSFGCWAIENPTLYKSKVGVTTNSGKEKVSSLITKNLKLVLSQQSLQGILSSKAANLEAIETEILKLTREEAAKEYGISISKIGIDRLELPEEVTSAVFTRMSSEREKMVEKIASEGKYQAQKIRNEADSEKSRLIAEAEAKATLIKGEAETAAFENLSVYSQHSEFALFLKKLEALEKTMKKKTTLLIDRKTPPFDLLDGDISIQEKAGKDE